jgi:hypothetical protein
MRLIALDSLLMYPFLLIIINKLFIMQCPQGENQVIALNKAHWHGKEPPQTFIIIQRLSCVLMAVQIIPEHTRPRHNKSNDNSQHWWYFRHDSLMQSAALSYAKDYALSNTLFEKIFRSREKTMTKVVFSRNKIRQRATPHSTADSRH